MASWQAKLMSFLLRHTLRKKLIRAAGNVEAARAAMAAGKYRVPKGVDIRAERVGGIPGEWVQPRGEPAKITMLYLHGGGYFACSAETHRPATCAFAAAGMRVFAPNYRLAPEHPFPAAVDDARAVLAGLLAELDGADRLVVAGDSAGGGLALALMVAERDAGRPLPAAGILFSPWVDLAVTGPSVAANEARCAMFTADGIRNGAQLYLNGADPRDPLASPLYADLHGLPPLLIHVSDAETLCDDGVRLAERAQAHGVSTVLRRWEGLPHVWHLFHQVIPEGRGALVEATAFAFQHARQVPVSAVA